MGLHFNNNVLSAQFVNLFAIFFVVVVVLLFRCWWNLDDDLVLARLWKTRLGSIACAGNRARSTLNPLTADPLKWNLGTPWTPARLQPHGIALFLILHNSRQIYWGLRAEGNVVPEEKVLALAPTFSCSCAFSCHSCNAAFGRRAAKRLLHKHVSSTVEFLSFLLTPSFSCSGLDFPFSFFAAWKQITVDVGGEWNYLSPLVLGGDRTWGGQLELRLLSGGEQEKV